MVELKEQPAVRPATPEEIIEQQHHHPDDTTTAWSMRKCAEHAASVPFGQFVFKKLHNALWCIENTLRFLPMPDERPTDGRAMPTAAESTDQPPSSSAKPSSSSQQQQPIRPLPWLLFLPTLIACKVAVMTANGLAHAVHREPLTGAQIITRIQAYRRDLRAIRQAGQRIVRLQGKRNRLGPLSRVARILSESLIRMRPATQPGKTSMSRKTSQIDVNVDLATALNQSYNESDDLHDATFCPDESLDRSHDLSMGNDAEEAATNDAGDVNNDINAGDESHAADASDEHESSADSVQMEFVENDEPMQPLLRAEDYAPFLAGEVLPSPGFAGAVRNPGGRLPIRMYANNGPYESVLLQALPGRNNDAMQIIREELQAQNMI